MPADKISLDKAKPDKLFYFVANVVVYRESDGRCLLLKRSETEKVHPGKYCVPGGKLEWNQLDPERSTRRNGDVLDYEDVVEELLAREVQEEAGIEIEPKLKYVNSVAYIRPDGVPTVLIKFAVRYRGGEVKVERGSFTDHVWTNAVEVRELDCIRGIPEEVSQTIKMFSFSSKD